MGKKRETITFNIETLKARDEAIAKVLLYHARSTQSA